MNIAKHLNYLITIMFIPNVDNISGLFNRKDYFLNRFSYFGYFASFCKLCTLGTIFTNVTIMIKDSASFDGDKLRQLFEARKF